MRQPLKQLKHCGNMAARLLLLLYKHCSMEEYGGVSPFKGIYNKYEYCRDHHEYISHNFRICVVKKSSLVSYPKQMSKVLGFPVTQETPYEKESPYWKAFEAIVSHGFFYEVITVFDGDVSQNPDAIPLYELDTKQYHGSVHDKEKGLAKRIDRLYAAFNGNSIADKLGRFYKEYPVLIRPGVLPWVYGIYRPRFRVINKKNTPVKIAWKTIQNRREEWTENVELLEGLLKIGKAENSAQEPIHPLNNTLE